MENDDMEYERFKGYSYSHIITALDDDHMFLGGSMVTMQNCIDSINEKSEIKYLSIEQDLDYERGRLR